MEGFNINRLLIVGAGGHGRCCLNIARESYDEIAFLDDNHINERINDCKVIGAIDDIGLYFSDYQDIIIVVGNNKLRKRITIKAVELGYNIVSLISKDSVISKYAKINQGVVIFSNAVVESNAFIGEGSIVTSNVTINHDATIEEYILIYSNTVIRLNALIGSFTCIGSNCTVCFGVKLKAGSDISDGKIIELDNDYCFEMGV